MSIDFYDRFVSFAESLQPEIAIAFLHALRDLASGYRERAVTDALARGDVDAAANIVAGEVETALALVPVQEQLRVSLIRSAVYFFADTPKGPIGPTRTTAVIRFNSLSPDVTRAAEQFESPLLRSLGAEIHDSVKAVMQRQLGAGIGPRTAARELRELIGLSDTGYGYAQNYRAELEALNQAIHDGARVSRVALGRELTDGRIDRTVARAIRERRALTTEDINRAVAAYAKNLKANEAETLTRTASLNAAKEGQRLAWKQAITAGKIRSDDLVDTWHTTLDGRERPTHHDMHGRTKPFDEQWYVPGVGPQDYPGQSEYNCRCVVFTRPRIRRASELAQAVG